jgi:hypothetical protein
MDFVQTYTDAIPVASFQSTSTLQPSGSAYASSPMLSTDGSATYSGYTTQTQTQAPGRDPRRVGPPTPGGNPTPVGDALIPLMVMAILYTFVNRIRMRKVS